MSDVHGRGRLLEDLNKRAHEEDWRRSRERRVIGMPASMKAVGDFAPALVGAMVKDGAIELRDAPSSALLQWDVAIGAFSQRRRAEGFGEERIAADRAIVEASCKRMKQFCESPIEHQIAPWLLCQNYGQWACCAPVVHVPKEDDVPPDAGLMIVPQFAFARFRVDFAMVAKFAGYTKIIAVECDGKDFHEGGRDFKRDQYLLGWNIPTVRATGSEISRNPRQVAESVARYILDWACGLGLRP